MIHYSIHAKCDGDGCIGRHRFRGDTLEQAWTRLWTAGWRKDGDKIKCPKCQSRLP